MPSSTKIPITTIIPNNEMTLMVIPIRLPIKNIPKNISCIDKIEILIIDDGCTDKTIEIAESCGINHLVKHERNLGIASAFRNGVAYCLENGADIIVNTDGDNQYDWECIKDLVTPIVNKKYADVNQIKKKYINNKPFPHFVFDNFIQQMH